MLASFPAPNLGSKASSKSSGVPRSPAEVRPSQEETAETAPDPSSTAGRGSGVPGQRERETDGKRHQTSVGEEAS